MKLIGWLLLAQIMPNHTPVDDELRHMLSASLAPRLRTMREFAEQEIVLGEGPYAGRRFRCARQPESALWFAEIDDQRWRRYALTKCVQAGKSLQGYVIPCLHTLFELHETCILGAPTLDVCAEKFRKEILPVIQRSRYAALLPAHGRGSRGGLTTSIDFRNGASLKFMGAGGGDEQRSSYTSRVVVMTEVDKMDTASEHSRETSPIGQMEARTESYGAAARIFMECTVSIVEGAIWSEYLSGTRSRIACPCPHCQAFVTPERDDLVGWETAENKIAAAALATWCCPQCGEEISEEQRHAMNAAAVLLHDGQTIDPAGHIHGDAPQTDTLGFRASAFNNLFWSTPHIAGGEWSARFGKGDADDKERKRRQFVWVEPIESDKSEENPLDPYKLAERVHDTAKRGEVPPALTVRVSAEPKDEGREARGAGREQDSIASLVPLPVRKLTCGIDLRQKEAHWVAPCWADYATAHVVNYGKAKVFSERLGVERALLAALRYLRDKVLLPGFPIVGSSERRRPDCVLIDSGWKSPVVYKFIRECEADPNTAGVFKCCAGRGWAKSLGGRYSLPVKKSRSIRLIGEQYHFVRDPVELILRGLVNADYWKSQFHALLSTPDGEPGSLTLPLVGDGDHSEICRHWCAEREVRQWDAAKGGEVVTWETISRANHYFDASYLSLVAAHVAGIRRGEAALTETKPLAAGGKWFAARGKA